MIQAVPIKDFESIISRTIVSYEQNNLDTILVENTVYLLLQVSEPLYVDNKTSTLFIINNDTLKGYTKKTGIYLTNDIPIPGISYRYPFLLPERLNNVTELIITCSVLRQ